MYSFPATFLSGMSEEGPSPGGPLPHLCVYIPLLFNSSPSVTPLVLEGGNSKVRVRRRNGKASLWYLQEAEGRQWAQTGFGEETVFIAEGTLTAQ